MNKFLDRIKKEIKLAKMEAKFKYDAGAQAGKELKEKHKKILKKDDKDENLE